MWSFKIQINVELRVLFGLVEFDCRTIHTKEDVVHELDLKVCSTIAINIYGEGGNKDGSQMNHLAPRRYFVDFCFN